MTLQLVLSLVMLGGLLPPNPNPWQEVNKREDITVWAREVPNSNVHEVRAESIIDAPIKDIWAVLGDIDHFVDFMPYVVETWILKTKGNGHFEYTLLNPPLVSQRDYTLEITTVEDPNGEAFVRSWTSANHKGPPPRDGAVRLDLVEGSWTLEKLDEARTRATYTLLTDPGGSIPNWMANKANTTSLPDLMNAVRQRSLNPNYHR